MNIDLRLLDISDKEEYWKVGFKNPDEEMFYYTGTKNHPTKEEIDAFIEKSISSEERRHFLICDNNIIIGEVVLMDIDDEYKSCSFRIAIFNKNNFNKGIGLKATNKALEIAFTKLNLHRVELEVFDYNPRARAMYEKAGFKLEGTKRDSIYINNKFYHVHIMSILEEEFSDIYN